MNIVGIIPARLGSKRFPNKLTSFLLGKPVIEHVIEHALQFSFLDKVVVATDSHDLDEYIKDYDIEIFYMEEDVWCGSMRSLYYYFKNKNYDWYVSIPADEPMLDPDEINTIDFHSLTEYVYTLYSPFYSYERLESLSSCKIAGGTKAQYFSRNIIPCTKSGTRLEITSYKKHIGMFLFHKLLFDAFGEYPWSRYSGSHAEIEGLEQNIFIENDIPVGLLKINHRYYGIDIPDDIKALESIYKKQEEIW